MGSLCPLLQPGAWWRSYGDEDPPNHYLQQAILLYLNAQTKLQQQLSSATVQLVKVAARRGGSSSSSSDGDGCDCSNEYCDSSVGGTWYTLQLQCESSHSTQLAYWLSRSCCRRCAGQCCTLHLHCCDAARYPPRALPTTRDARDHDARATAGA